MLDWGPTRCSGWAWRSCSHTVPSFRGYGVADVVGPCEQIVNAGSGVKAVGCTLRDEESVGNGGILREIGSVNIFVASF